MRIRNVRGFAIRSAVAAAACTLALSGGAIAQSNSAGQRGGSIQQQADPAFVDLDFRGGNAAEYIEALRKAAGDKVNVVVMDQVDAVSVPAVRLRGVDFASAIGILNGESSETDSAYVKLDVRAIEPSSIGGPIAGVSRRVFKVTAEMRPKGPDLRSQMSSIWSVVDLLGSGFSADDISTAISSALDLMLDGAEPANIRFHEETGLIMAFGSHQEIEVVSNVIDQLRVAASQRYEQERRGSASQSAQLNKAYQEAEEGRRDALNRLTDVTQELESWKARAQAIEQEFAQATHRSAKLESEMDTHRTIIRELESRLAQVSAELKRAQSEDR